MCLNLHQNLGRSWYHETSLSPAVILILTIQRRCFFCGFFCLFVCIVCVFVCMRAMHVCVYACVRACVRIYVCLLPVKSAYCSLVILLGKG